MLYKVNPTKTKAWENVQKHYENNSFNINNLFLHDEKRFNTFSIQKNNFIFDYSKNLITQETIDLLVKLAEDCKLKEAINSMFSGSKINETEDRAVLHVALRSHKKEKYIVNNKDILVDIKNVLNRMEEFSEDVISGRYKGFSGKEILDVVNIGIGGSDLGPHMVVSAMSNFKTRLNVHFVSNVDGEHIRDILKDLSPETTLFIISSKTFTTEETMMNAESAKRWFVENGGSINEVSTHFVAISTNASKVDEFGISRDNLFEFWDWVGGRFSLWSAIGLSIMLAIGYSNFISLLDGANDIDEHFKSEEFKNNIPVLMGLLGIWYRNFYKSNSYAVLPYSQNMHLFPKFLQQLDMESNGKNIDRNGLKIEYSTGPIIFGEAGTNGQHAFYQLLHQGTEFIPSDFIGFVNSNSGNSDHHDKLIANLFAQSEALAFGQEQLENKREVVDFKKVQGNKPSNTILFKTLDPFSLGQLIALYEHKIFVQGVIWNVFSFDQFGVELGKKLAKNIQEELKKEIVDGKYDSSTKGLINFYKENYK